MRQDICEGNQPSSVILFSHCSRLVSIPTGALQKSYEARHSQAASRKCNPLWRCTIIQLEDDSISHGEPWRQSTAESAVQQKLSQKKPSCAKTPPCTGLRAGSHKRNGKATMLRHHKPLPRHKMDHKCVCWTPSAPEKHLDYCVWQRAVTTRCTRALLGEHCSSQQCDVSSSPAEGPPHQRTQHGKGAGGAGNHGAARQT